MNETENRKMQRESVNQRLVLFKANLKKGKKAHVTDVKHENRDVTSDSTGTKRIVRKNDEQLHTHKLDNLDAAEMLWKHKV